MIPDRVFMGYLEEAIGKDNARIAFSAFEEEPATSVRLNPFKPGADFGCGSTQVPWSRYGLMLDSRPRFTLDPMLHDALEGHCRRQRIRIGHDIPFQAFGLQDSPDGIDDDGFSRTIQAGNYSDRNMAFRFLNGKVHIAGLERAYVFQMEIDNTHASYF